MIAAATYTAALITAATACAAALVTGWDHAAHHTHHGRHRRTR